MTYIYDSLVADVTKTRERAQALAMQHTDELRRLNNDKNLNDEGRKNLAQESYFNTKEGASLLQKQETGLFQKAENDLKQNVFGIRPIGTSDLIAYRDAQERVDRLDGVEPARKMFDRALLSSDTVLASAVVARALEVGWHSIVQAYKESYPDRGDWIDDLARVQSDKSNRFSGLGNYMVAKPNEAKYLR